LSLTVAFLKNGGTLEDLQQKYAIKFSRHGVYPNLVQLKYSQTGSPMHEPIVQECRGIILDEADGWRIAARGFCKFFNHAEPNAAVIDWPSARVQEKLDGSLIMLYWYRDELQVATTGRPDASGVSFRALLLRTLPEPFAVRERSYTYLMELTTPFNRVIVRHAESSATLIAMRHSETGEYAPPELVHSASRDLGIPVVREFPLTSLEAILSTFATMAPLDQEGYVIVDGFHNRIKVKHPGYVALSQMKSGLSPKSFVEAIRKGETTEVLAHFPELEPTFLPIQTAFEALAAEVEADYRELAGIETQKEFAEQALKRRCSAALFSMRAGKVSSVREYFAVCTIAQMIRLLGIRDSDETEGTAE
jgi:hypothetical protein